VAAPCAPDVTRLLLAWRDGDDAARERLIPLVYRELRALAHAGMRGEPRGITLQTTALVHEAYLRLVEVRQVSWQNRSQFFALCAQAMRRILVDAARARHSLKRGGRAEHVPLDEALVASPARDGDVLAVDEALTDLANADPRKARVVELRYFGGLSVEETAEVLRVSPQTVMRDWKLAKLWLIKALRNREVSDAGPRMPAEGGAAVPGGADERGRAPRGVPGGRVRERRRPAPGG
jgi:RNA polymerase sigma-70 factor, ECF subfamily